MLVQANDVDVMDVQLAKTIWVVRPSQQTQTDCLHFEQAGWRAVPFSVMDIQADEQVLANLSTDCANAKVVFWVSPSAVQMAAPVLKTLATPVLHIAVGKASYQALTAFFTDIICPEDGKDSEAVLRLPIWQQLPAHTQIVIIRGKGGRDLLAQTLRQQGFEVKIIEAYQRVPLAVDWQQLEQSLPDAVYITSSEMVKWWFESAPLVIQNRLKSLLYFTHHIKIADTLKHFGVQRVELHDPRREAAPNPLTTY